MKAGVTKVRVTPGGRSQANGVLDNFNKQLRRAMRAYAYDLGIDPEQTLPYLPGIIHGIRTHANLNYSRKMEVEGCKQEPQFRTMTALRNQSEAVQGTMRRHARFKEG